ncbi:hypothetical protein DSL72_002720 [Monilinia vaccinii-corymbosi]|uniref:Uncharacterized protein n=1 Tax=Monilinia vaccinii-corymbosi TaxID=61207 RepID=A0A8A3PDH2_9HELO|nr:hypothetical protein DSL72_002720 [Monilinia vaccinii-corymbosi]
MDSLEISAPGSVDFDTEPKPANFSNHDGSSTKDTSPGSEAMAPERKHPSDYRYLAVRPREDSKSSASNPDSSRSQSSQNHKNAVPLTHRIKHATLKNPYNAEVYKYTYTEFEPTGAIPILGFVPQPAPENIELPASKPDEPEEPWKTFPPPANTAYAGLGRKTEEEYDPQPLDNFDVALDGAGLAIKNAPSPQKVVSVEIKSSRGRQSTGDMVATGIDFTQKAWIRYEPSASGEIYNEDEQKADFIRNLDEGAQIEFCKKCKERHIPPGSPITLSERDPCGAYLPEWFPSEGVHKPWSNFRQMLNHWVLLCEMEQGYTHRENPERPVWNLEFHDTHEKWRQIGRSRGLGGWWKCRSGPGATYAERSCRVCTSKDAAAAREGELGPRRVTTIAEHKANIENWIAKRIEDGGHRDREAVLAMWRANGIPQHYGPPISRNGMYPVTEGTRSVTGVSELGPRTFLLPAQMFSERLFKSSNNGHAPPLASKSQSQSMDEARKTSVSDSGLGSSSSSTS